MMCQLPKLIGKFTTFQKLGGGKETKVREDSGLIYWIPVMYTIYLLKENVSSKAILYKTC